jgi:DNA-binding transcriptional ArsR family regulator
VPSTTVRRTPKASLRHIGTKQLRTLKKWLEWVPVAERPVTKRVRNNDAVTLYQELQNPALIQAVAHPLRARMLSILQDRAASPKELAGEFEIPLANVAYHIQVLRKLKLIKLVKKTPRRGAVEHHYRADYGAHIKNEAWDATPEVIKRSVVGAALAEIGNDVTDAATLGGFEHADAVLTRTKLVLDQDAWEELSAMLIKVLNRADELEKEAEKRLRAAGHDGERRAGLALMLFESMPSVPGADAAKTPASSASRRRKPSRARVTV